MAWTIGLAVQVLARRHRLVALGKLLTPVCLCHQAVFGTGQGALMLLDDEGNLRPGGN